MSWLKFVFCFETVQFRLNDCPSFQTVVMDRIRIKDSQNLSRSTIIRNKIKVITIFREEATSVSAAAFHAGPLPWSNWNLEMLIFVKGRKGGRKMRANSKRNPHMVPGPAKSNSAGSHWW